MTPAAARASTWWRIMGRLANSTRGLGSVRVCSESGPGSGSCVTTVDLEVPVLEVEVECRSHRQE